MNQALVRRYIDWKHSFHTNELDSLFQISNARFFFFHRVFKFCGLCKKVFSRHTDHQHTALVKILCCLQCCYFGACGQLRHCKHHTTTQPLTSAEINHNFKKVLELFFDRHKCTVDVHSNTTRTRTNSECQRYPTYRAADDSQHTTYEL